MCLSCGCGQKNENHGKKDLITMDDMEKAAKAANMDVKQAAKNICQACGMDVKERMEMKR